ncbi:DUF4886 domain-containing protein [Filimonas effusa]|nr:DUF4886 domain-containing protein [Filimonas effusa]
MREILKNYRFACLTICLFLFASAPALALPLKEDTLHQSALAKNDTLRLFIIGNSFSQNASKYLPQLAAEGKHPLKIGRAELPGCPMERHWRHAAAAEANPADSNGMPYKGKSLRTLLSEDKWDIVTIQQASVFSSDSSTYYPYARNLYNYVKSICPGAEVVIHQTWAYRSDDKVFGQTSPAPHKTNAKDAEEMYLKSRAAYHKIAGELKIRILPVGDAFWKVTTDPARQFKKDTSFNYANPVYPAVPDQTNSLHMGYRWENKKFGYDGHHANTAGCFLGALVWYSKLFHESPQKLKYCPGGVSAEFCSYLKKVAAKE